MAKSGKSGAPELGLRRGMSVLEASARILEHHLTVVTDNEAGTVEGEDIEYLHRMRVGVRRVRSCLRVFRKHLGKKRVREFSDDLQWLGSVLGAVRDLDVFLRDLGKHIESADDGCHEVLEALAADRAGARESAREPVVEALRSERYHDCINGLAAFIEELHAVADKSADPRLREVAPRALRKRWKDVMAFKAVLDVETPSDDELHQLRVACKWMRYTAEFFAEPYGKGLNWLIRRAKRIQDCLGEINDIRVMAEFLDAYAAECRDGSRDDEECLQAFLDARRRRAEDARKRFVKDWQFLSRRSAARRALSTFESI